MHKKIAWDLCKMYVLADLYYQHHLYADESATTPSSYLPKGMYYIYDGKCCKNGRFRVTTKAEYCGKTPAGKYVTGYVSVDNFA